ncbi:MAG TPA: PH domain-containing protein, partial [Methylomirabilota bacterium]|nr:PH domain-containing protein [Methylomirabilota bacterium]
MMASETEVPGELPSREPRPPALPPPIPPGAGGEPSPATDAGDTIEGRLHPLTLVCTAWDIIRGWLIPVVVLLLLGSRGAIVVLSAVIVLPQIAFALVRYFTFYYRITDTELMTRQGLIEKRERHIRLERVQDIRVEQSLLHRLLNMAVVQVETAGGMGAEATLSVIPLQRAEQLRQAIFARKLNLTPSAAAPEPEPSELLHGLSVRDLVVAGLTSNRMATVLV